MGRPLDGLAKDGDEELTQWGAEVAGYQMTLNGWSREGLLGRLVRQGPQAASQLGAGATEISDWALAIDKAVTNIENEMTRRVLFLWYCSRDRGNQALCAARMKMSDRWFRWHLKEGREDIGKLVRILWRI